jgi:hypothetical protein
MSIAAEKVIEMLALPEQDQAYQARQLLASLDDTVDADAETQWHAVIDRRSRETEEGKVSRRPVFSAISCTETTSAAIFLMSDPFQGEDWGSNTALEVFAQAELHSPT